MAGDSLSKNTKWYNEEVSQISTFTKHLQKLLKPIWKPYETRLKPNSMPFHNVFFFFGRKCENWLTFQENCVCYLKFMIMIIYHWMNIWCNIYFQCQTANPTYSITYYTVFYEQLSSLTKTSEKKYVLKCLWNLSEDRLILLWKVFNWVSRRKGTLDKKKIFQGL